MRSPGTTRYVISLPITLPSDYKVTVSIDVVAMDMPTAIAIGTQRALAGLVVGSRITPTVRVLAHEVDHE